MAKPAFVLLLTLLLPISVDCSLHAQDGTPAELGTGNGSGNAVPIIGGTGVGTEAGPGNTTVGGTETPGAPSVEPKKDGTPESAGPLVVVNPKKKLTLTEELFSNPLNYLLLLIVCVYVYLLFLRPNAGRKETREQIEKLKNLKKNDRVVTTAGIHGIVSNINSEAGTVTLRVDENTNTKLTIDRLSIRSVLP